MFRYFAVDMLLRWLVTGIYGIGLFWGLMAEAWRQGEHRSSAIMDRLDQGRVR
ncbi:MAG: hypothetical protein HQL73_07170 [Magnetococcales bacterium]|nr:hypothetical protein [Magnetococcales bacterium]